MRRFAKAFLEDVFVILSNLKIHNLQLILILQPIDWNESTILVSKQTLQHFFICKNVTTNTFSFGKM